MSICLSVCLSRPSRKKQLRLQLYTHNYSLLYFGLSNFFRESLNFVDIPLNLNVNLSFQCLF